MTSKQVIEKFAKLGAEEVVETTNATYEQMQEVFKAYPAKHFTQKEFKNALGASNPFINHQLHKLLENGVVERKGSRRQYYYIAKQ